MVLKRNVYQLILCIEGFYFNIQEIRLKYYNRLNINTPFIGENKDGNINFSEDEAGFIKDIFIKLTRNRKNENKSGLVKDQ